MHASSLLLSTATLMALLAPVATHAQGCDALKETVLTSSGCPAKCTSSPCVLYSPSQNEKCEAASLAGQCHFDDAFILPGATAPCNLTYQCLDSLVDAHNNKWFLALTPSSLVNTVTTVPVTQVSQLTYPSTGVYTVQVAGGFSRNARGEFKNVALDDSLYNTPPSVVSFYLSDMNLQNVIETVEFNKRSWYSVAFNNCNLKQVPTGLTQLPLQYVELTKNYISNISDPAPFKIVSTFNLAYNELTDLSIDLPAIVTLNLTGNPLSKIPDSIFSMRTLLDLHMRQCNLTNIHLTDTQFAFLAQRQTLDVDFVVTSCAKGYAPRKLPHSDASVCMLAPATLETTNSSGSTSSGLTVGIVVGADAVIVAAAIGLVLVRRRRRQANDSAYASMSKLDTRSDDTWPTEGTSCARS